MSFLLNDINLVPAWFFPIFIFLFGICIGSFLNVVIYRLPREQSVIWPTSHCPKCNYSIAAYDNIPLLSYLLLLGRCRQCKVRISPIYPFIEFITGILFLLTFWHDGLSLKLIPDLIFISSILVLIFIDYFEQILPDVITKPGTVVSFLLRFFDYNLIGVEAGIISILLNLLGLSETHYNLRYVSIFNSAAGMAIGGGTLWLIGIGYFRLRRFRTSTLKDFGLFLRDNCVLGTLVRLHIRRSGRTEHIYIEGGNFSELSAQELENLNLKLSEQGTQNFIETSLTGIQAEDIRQSTNPSGILIIDIPSNSLAAEYGLKPGDVITHANIEGMGLGDVKMMLFVGAFLGWELTLLTLCIASFLGGLVAVYKLIKEGREALQTSVPFGVMLGIGALISFFFGVVIINKYLETFTAFTIQQ